MQKKNIKNVYLRVLPPEGELHMSVPVGCTQAEILDFLTARREWVAASQPKLRERQQRSGTKGKRQYVTGEKLLLWGKAYDLVVRETPEARKSPAL